MWRNSREKMIIYMSCFKELAACPKARKIRSMQECTHLIEETNVTCLCFAEALVKSKRRHAIESRTLRLPETKDN